MSKRLPALGVAVVGIVVLIVLFTTNLFTVANAFEELTDEFRPIMTVDALLTAKTDVATLGAVGEEFNNEIAPQVAEALGMTSDELNTFLGTNFPAAAAGLAALPEAVPTLSDAMALLSDQQENFETADQIPTSNLPVQTVPWLVLIIGIGMLVVAFVMLRGTRTASLIAIVFGAVVVLVSVLLSFLPKAAAADDLNTALKPAYNQELVSFASQTVGVVGAMGHEINDSLLPALQGQLGMDDAGMQAFLSQFPTTAGVLENLDPTLDRFQTLVTALDSQLDNYVDIIKPVTLTPIVLSVVVAGLLVIVCGVWGFMATKEEPVAATSEE